MSNICDRIEFQSTDMHVYHTLHTDTIANLSRILKHFRTLAALHLFYTRTTQATTSIPICSFSTPQTHISLCVYKDEIKDTDEH